MIRFAALAAFALVIGSGAAANDSDNQGASSEEAKEEKKICRTETMTGYRARRVRTCMTQREWEKVAQGSRRGANEYISDQNRVPPPSP